MRLLIDTNLLMLYVAGRANKRIIDVHKRLRPFDHSDYEWLCAFAERYDGLLLIPNVTTETSNLLAQVSEPFRSDLRQTLKLVGAVETEIYVSSLTAMNYDEYHWLGLTDAAILDASAGDVTSLTTDLGLYRAAVARGLRCVSYSQARYGAL